MDVKKELLKNAGLLNEEKMVLNSSQPIYRNPTPKEAIYASNLGVRFIVYEPTKSVFITGANNMIHYTMLNLLNITIKPYRKPKDDEISHDLDLNMICGMGHISKDGKIIPSRSDGADCDDNVKATVRKKLKKDWSWSNKYFTIPIKKWLLDISDIKEL